MKKNDYQNWTYNLLLFYFSAVAFSLISDAILGWFGIITIDGRTAVRISFLGPLVFIVFAAAVIVIAVVFSYMCNYSRRYGRDRRIIRQAKAAGVWDKPLRLGGRALELKAWQLCGLRRIPGETDQQLRYRLAGKIPKAGQAAGQPGWKERMLRHFLRGH